MRGLAGVIRYLEQAARGGTRPVHLVVVGFGEQQAIRYSMDLEMFLQKEFARIAADRGFALFQLDEQDFCFLVPDKGGRAYGSVTEIRAALHRGLEQFMPGTFGSFDLSRVVSAHDLSISGDSPLELLQAHMDRKRAAAGPGRAGEELSADHLARLEKARRELGPAELVARVVRSQRVFMQQGPDGFAPVFTEYYCAMDAVRRELIGDVDLRQNRNMFNMLTVRLDRILLDSFALVNPSRDRCSINLNVESVFTAEFERFTKHCGDLGRVVIEFRASDIMQNFDEFLVARDHLCDRGAVLAVDAMFPRMVGVLNPAELGVKIAKLFTTNDGYAQLADRKRQIGELQKSGVTLIASRVQDAQAFRMAAEAGIRMFQGFHMDRLVRGQAA
ncbi:MAG TPA: hypothetical protein VEB20_11620 [Azospirillaceae bacterium]|nr:hypothetical protein [Azospirillaceae bacterium]